MLDALVGDPAQGVVRAILLAGIMGMTGGAMFAARIVPAFDDRDDRATARQGALRFLQLSAILLSLAVGARLVQQAAAFADTPAQWPGAVGLVLAQTTWGKGWLLQAGALPWAVLAARGALGRDARGPLGGLALGGAILALCATPALSGHAVGAPRLATAAVLFDAAHVLAAGAWLGTLAAIARVALPIALDAAAARAGAGGALMVRLLARFSPIALGSAMALAATGAFASWLHLGTLPALWTTPYGQMLALKLGILAGVAVSGAYNWKVVTPRLVAGGDLVALRRAVTIELVFAAALVGVTAVLVATPLPAEM